MPTRIVQGQIASAITRILGAAAVTIGSRILVSRETAREIERASDDGRRILRHELAHVEQYARDGFVPFLAIYFFDYLRGRRRGLSHFEAYAEIRYEREAARAESG
jgi:hypothetical protein